MKRRKKRAYKRKSKIPLRTLKQVEDRMLSIIKTLPHNESLTDNAEFKRLDKQRDKLIKHGEKHTYDL